MKYIKYIIILVSLVLVALTYYYFQNNSSFTQSFYVENSRIVNKSGEILNIKGLVYSPYYPSESGGDDLPNDDRYFDHLNRIENLGANSISVFPQKMPENFFTALKESNLNYVQIIDINLYDGSDNRDLLSNDYQEKAFNHIKEIIDYNYSFKTIDKLLYFVLGYEINPTFIQYTNNYHKDINSYKGKYIEIENKTASEVALAKLLDKSINYEVKKYSHRSLYSHNSFPAYNLLDQNSLLFPDFFDIVSINLYPSFFYNKNDYFKEIKEDSIKHVNNGFLDYLKTLDKKTNKPIVISELGLPSVNNANYINGVPAYGDNSEKAVSSLYLRSFNDIKEFLKEKNNSFAGLFYFEFLDEWWKNGEEENDANYHNPNDPEEWFGIYSVKKNNTKQVEIQEKEEIIKALKNIFKQYD
jgi:hypothetical protein